MWIWRGKTDSSPLTRRPTTVSIAFFVAGRRVPLLRKTCARRSSGSSGRSPARACSPHRWSLLQRSRLRPPPGPRTDCGHHGRPWRPGEHVGPRVGWRCGRHSCVQDQLCRHVCPAFTQEETALSGIQEPNVIDLVTHDPVRDEYKLIMVEDRPWAGAPGQLEQLREKINNYAMFVLDEGLLRSYPEAAGHPVCIQLDCVSTPTAEIQELIDLASERLRDYGIRFAVNQVG
ncbi:DUF6572 domain-containing protein [Pseudarthrobacter sp. AG30]|uniref:DUF6572 domain-containing protein n=1 Tax=Pseudarthrobacter sp. AG30 TaxID=2249742 RepID=UPI0034CFC219